MVLGSSAQKEFAYIWQSKWVGVIAIEIARTQIHFFFFCGRHCFGILNSFLVTLAASSLPLTMLNFNDVQE